MPQDHLATIANMTPAALSRIETGKVEPETATLRLLLRLLGFSKKAHAMVAKLIEERGRLPAHEPRRPRKR
jgi:predicted transcriptional regulator